MLRTPDVQIFTVFTVASGTCDWRAANGNQEFFFFYRCIFEGQESVPGPMSLVYHIFPPSVIT